MDFAEWIVSLLIPGGGIVKLIQGIYKLVMFFVDNIQRIIRWVGAVLDSLGSIAAGAIPSAITFIVDAMKTIIPVILDFFAKLLNISGIVNAVQDIIAKVTAPIHKAIDKFVAWISKLMEKVLKRFKGGKQEKEPKAAGQPQKEEKEQEDSKSTKSQKINSFADINADFKDETRHNHRAYYEGSKLIIASDPMPVEKLLLEREDKAEKNKDEELKKEVAAARSYYYGTVKPLEDALKKADLQDNTENSRESIRKQKNAKDYEDNKKLHNALQKAIDIFAEQYLDLLFDAAVNEYPPSKLPVMADNVKARSFTADYISDKVPNGSESRKHVGNLEGWAQLKGRKIKDDRWVRMHLLPHRLGGNACRF
ncbi:hypothetical protein [Flavobacterium coralii]|uniref:hypothetical protein n=1 Tax=Flavobacterium coralii TaxID=2838017 RepID=UPI0032B27677